MQPATMPEKPTFAFERRLWRHGVGFVASVVEVGRGHLAGAAAARRGGPRAGPVAAGAVSLPAGARSRWLSRVRDSKQLPPRAREELAAYIWRHSLAAAVAFVPVSAINRIGICEA